MKSNLKKSNGSVIDLLYDEFNSAIENKSRLNVFYGSDRSVNSALCRQLYSRIFEEKNVICTYADFKIPANRETDALLISLRNHFNKEYDAVFPSFDLACAYYLYMTNSEISPLKDDYPLFAGKGPLKSVARAVTNLPVKSFMTVLNGIFTTPGSRYKQWWQKRGKSELVNVTSLEPEQILLNLNNLWIEDFNEFLNSNGGETVIFFDSFENILPENDPEGSGLFNRLILKCIERTEGARFVLMSDSELKTGRPDGDLPYIVRNIPLDKLFDRSSSDYLKHSGIEDGVLAAFIEKECAGIPHLLNLAIDIHREIINAGIRKPCTGDFSSLSKNAREKLFAVLTDGVREALKILTCAESWDKDLFILLTGNFCKVCAPDNWDAIRRFTFITESGPEGFYSMDENIRKILITDSDAGVMPSVCNFLFQYYDKSVKSIDFDNITGNDKENFRKAFYYAQKRMRPLELAEWSSAYFEGFREKGLYRFLLPFLNTVTEYVENGDIDESKELAAILQSAGICYKEAGKYKRSEKLLSSAVRIYKNVYGEDSREVAGCVLNLADALFCQGDFGNAEPLYLKSIVLLNPLGDKDSTFSVVSMINLAILFARQGNYDKAVSLFEKILAIRMKLHGEEHPDVHRIQTNIANIELERKNYKEAEALYRKILDSKKSYYGDYHPEVSKAMINLGNVLIELGSYAETAALYGKAKEIFEEFYGREHPDYAMTLNNLAYLNFLSGNFEESKTFYLQALDIYKNILGSEHPDIAILYNNIGLLYTRMKEFADAEVFLKKSLEININKFGFDKPGTGYSYKSLAEFNEATGNFKEALICYEKYESIMASHFPEDSPDIKTAREKIASLKK